MRKRWGSLSEEREKERRDGDREMMG